MMRLYRRFFTGTPLPPPGSFQDQIVVVTGGTTGLGLAAAVHYVRLGAAKVVITCRNATRGETARQRIEQEAGISGRVDVMELDMSNFKSCIDFAENLKSKYDNGGRGIDAIVLNAGTFPYQFAQTSDGWNESLQVNTLSTILLAGLMLPWMKECRKNRKEAAHMVFVSSGMHLEPKVEPWVEISRKQGVLSYYNEEKSWPGYTSMYAISKLLLMYGLEEMAKLAKGKDGQPLVVVNSLCPGPVATDLARGVTDHNPLLRPLVIVFQAVKAVGPDYGSRIYITSSKGGVESHGRFLLWYKSDDDYQRSAHKVLHSPEAQEVQRKVWKETVDALSVISPDFSSAVHAK